MATAGLAALIGLGTGVTGALAFRFSERERGGPAVPAPDEDPVPPGVAAVLQVLRSSAVLLDSSDAVVKASPSAYSMGLVKSRSITSPELLDLARKVRRDGEIRQMEMDLPHGAALMPSTVRIAPLGSKLVLVLVEDRTEARRLDEVRRDFVANVSHELKTPVGALSLLAEAVQAASDDPEAVRRFSGRMQQESHRLTSLVQDLIDLSRVQIDAPLAATAGEVEVAAVVADALQRSYEAAASRRIEIVCEAAEEDIVVRGDQTQLSAALGNLVENAVNYSPERTRVAVTVKRVKDTVEIAVTDQGIGIPERDLERIFERFYRVDPARSRATGGTGLGLSIVKHIAATHGGEVSVWSAEGNGSTFTLKLPAYTEERDLARVV